MDKMSAFSHVPPPIRDPSHFSLWATPPSALANFQASSSLPATADVVIIGSGFSGASVAYHLLIDQEESSSTSNFYPSVFDAESLAASPNKKPAVVMLEARQACSGATGRNGGHLHPSFAYGAATWTQDDEHARQQHLKKIVFDVKNYNALAGLISHNNIRSAKSIFTENSAAYSDTADGSSIPAGWAVYDNQDEFAKVCAVVTSYLQASAPAVAEEDKKPIRIFSRDEARARTGLQTIAGAIYCPGTPLCGYNLVSWLLMECITKGNLNLHTNTPVLSVTKEAASFSSTTSLRSVHEQAKREKLQYVVNTPRGSIKTPVVVFATNAYTGSLIPKSNSSAESSKSTSRNSSKYASAIGLDKMQQRDQSAEFIASAKSALAAHGPVFARYSHNNSPFDSGAEILSQSGEPIDTTVHAPKPISMYAPSLRLTSSSAEYIESGRNALGFNGPSFSRAQAPDTRKRHSIDSSSDTSYCITVPLKTNLRTEIYPVRGQVAHYRVPSAVAKKHLVAIDNASGSDKLSLVWKDEYLAVLPEKNSKGGDEAAVDIVFGGCRRFGASKQVGYVDDNGLSDVVGWTLDDFFATRIGIPLVSGSAQGTGSESAFGDRPQSQHGYVREYDAMLGSFSGSLNLRDTAAAVKVQEWTGIMGFTKDDSPCIGSLSPANKPAEEEEEGEEDDGTRLLVVAGFGGHGMPRIFMSAQALVHRYLRRAAGSSEASAQWPSWFPEEYIN